METTSQRVIWPRRTVAHAVTDHKVIVHTDHRAIVHQDNRVIVHQDKRVIVHQDNKVIVHTDHVSHALTPMAMSSRALRVKDSAVATVEPEVVPVVTVVVIVDHVVMERRARTKVDDSTVTLDPRERKKIF